MLVYKQHWNVQCEHALKSAGLALGGIISKIYNVKRLWYKILFFEFDVLSFDMDIHKYAITALLVFQVAYGVVITEI